MKKSTTNLSPKANGVPAEGGQIFASTLKSSTAEKASVSHQKNAAEKEVTPERAQMPDAQAISIPRIMPAYQDGRLVLVPDCEDRNQGLEIIKKAIGACSIDFVHELLADLADIAEHARVTNLQKLNFLMSVITGMSPRDQLEAMLLTHMGVVHVGTMKAAQSLANATTSAEVETHVRTVVKLSRMFATQMDTLKRYRFKEQQKLTMQTVAFNVGAQAIVGSSTEKIMEQSKADALPASPASPELPITEPLQMPIMHERDRRSL